MMSQDKLIDLYRIRFENYYNGILTFDVHYCTYDCLFCFSKEDRYEVDNNIKNRNLRRVNIADLFFGDESKNYCGNNVNFNENSIQYKKYFDINSQKSIILHLIFAIISFSIVSLIKIIIFNELISNFFGIMTQELSLKNLIRIII